MPLPEASHANVPGAESIAGVRTHCAYCAFQCGIVIEAATDGGAPRVTGDESFPVNNGQLCIKGWTAGELLVHPDRLTRPQVRGTDGRLKPASWEAALDSLAERIDAIRAEFGPAALGAFGSGALSNEKLYLLGKFARVALRTPHIDYNGRYCMSSAAAGGNKAFGIDRGLPFPVADIAGAEVVMLVGSNAADTLPPIMQWFEKQKAAGGRLIVADPRRTPTARVADLHLPITPGSDLALANGLLFVAIDEELIDRNYIADRTTGFDEVYPAALAYHPARVERITGVSERSLRQTARLLARAKSSMVLTGRGPEQQSKGVDSVLGFINLMLALGKIGKPNSGFGTLTGQGNGQGGREHGQKADQLPGYRLIENEQHRRDIAAVWGVDPASLPRKGKSAYEMLTSLGPAGGIRGLLVMGSDVAVASPDACRVNDGLASLDCLAVCDSFTNDTSRHAHFVLPVAQWAEEDGTVTNLEGRVLLRRKAVERPAGVKTDIEVLCGLADRLGCGDKFAFGGSREVFDEFRRATAGGVADYSGMTYERLDAEPGICWPCPSPGHPGTPRLFAERFHHADGKARFHAVEHRPAGEEPDADYPFWLTTGRWKEHYNSGTQTRRVTPLWEARPRPRVQMHPRAAQRLGLTQDAPVIVESRRGRAEFLTFISHDIRPDTLFVPFHWGGAQAANRLTNGALDPTSRMPEFKVCAARVVVNCEE